MNLTFENKVALVTGAASGLGLATAKAFAESGASVVLADWAEKEVRAAAKELADKGHKTLAVTCDVSSFSRCEAAFSYKHETRSAWNPANLTQPPSET
jgi:NAD(P)-dependent dehydrogenase (short-subunit alcohol dehydrogenase family)